MAGISDKALKTGYAENKYRFQKQELQNKEFSDGSGLELYEFKYRMDDPQIGRFNRIDPLCDSFPHNSTYAFSEDKVINSVELEGLEANLAISWEYFRAREDAKETGGQQGAADFDKGAAVAAATIGVKGVEMGVAVVAPPIGIPLMLSDLSGVPLIPSPQATASGALEGAAVGAEGSSESTNLFRAVSDEELADVSQNGLRTGGGNSYETSKLFATTPQDASNFGRINFQFDQKPFTIVQANMPSDVMKVSTTFVADGMKAVAVPAEQLQNTNWVVPHTSTPVPNLPFITL
jgi:hypothetical protein